MTTALAPRAFKVDGGLHVPLDPLHATKLDQAAEEALRAADRLRSDPESQDHGDSDHWLVVAPYLEAEHLLDLRSIDTPNRLLALALTQLTAATTDYALVKYEDAFDWTRLMSTLKSLATSEGYTWTRQEFYVVEFRSKLYQDIDRDLLFKLDKESHAEATQAGGLLKYWYGVPNHERRNLATCKTVVSSDNAYH